MRRLAGLVSLAATVALLAGCSGGGETLDPKDSVAGQLKGIKNEPYKGREGGPAKVDKDAPKPGGKTAAEGTK